jgi:hypothetical protein
MSKTTTLSKTAAIREARRAVGRPIRVSSTSYQVYGPYRASEPNGPSTQHNYDSYPKALAGRTVWVARVAVALMGRLTDDASMAIEWAAEDRRGDPLTVESLVEEGLAAADFGHLGGAK